MNGAWWGIIGVIIGILGLGIPIAYGIKALLSKIFDLLKNVKDLVESVQITINNVNTTVSKMTEFISRNENQHTAMIQRMDAEFDRVVDTVRNEANRLMDKK